MTKTYGRLLTAMFCLFLGGLLAWHVLLPDREKSDVENRSLQQRPEFSWAALTDGSYTADVEAYFADQFPLRDGWTGLKARVEQLLGKREFHGVYLCGDTLISKVETPDETLVEKNLSYVRRLAEKTEIPVTLGFIPSAAEIWKDKLPAGAESWDQSAFLEQAAGVGVPMVDLKTTMEAHAGEKIFYRTDHHWTSLGAFYGANAVLDALGRESLNQADFAPEAVSDAFCGTLYSTSGIHWLPPDTMEFWAEEAGLSVTSWRSGSPEPSALYDRTYLAEKDKYSAFLGGNQPLCVIRNENLPGGGRVLLVRDSYADSLAPLLAQRFEEVHLLDLRYYRASVAQYAAEHGVDEIVVLYSVPNFITDKNVVFLSQ
ncbi:DHHW protein [Oscillibacter sp. PC13]|uniref:DHHW family protein n=1 Tax=Oscillibacter sp. PC13 TaxID=1855299 RepID=UPI0008E08E20|nr:DHHW family protein [Oscillibacter sp. PC13]SFP56494.1 DHHW protein [Oscillibacter sp. PC13]